MISNKVFSIRDTQNEATTAALLTEKCCARVFMTKSHGIGIGGILRNYSAEYLSSNCLSSATFANKLARSNIRLNI